MTLDDVRRTLNSHEFGNGSRTTALYRVVVLALILLNAVMNYADQGDDCVVEPNNESAVWEVVLRVDGGDVAIASAFERVDSKLDVVMGLVDRDTRHGVADILLYTSRLIRSGDFSESGFALHGGSSNGNETRPLPF